MRQDPNNTNYCAYCGCWALEQFEGFCLACWDDFKKKAKEEKERNISAEHAAHPVSSIYQAIDAFKDPPADEKWEKCPRCQSRPRIWTFNNGRSTACKCGRNQYDHWSIHAESILSFVKRNQGFALGYDHDELRKNWNRYCATGIVTFERPKGGRSDGRW